MDRKQYINEHRNLFWYTPESKKETISDSLLLETVLNYGSMDDCRQLIKMMGVDYAADVFFSAKGRQKLNYYPEIYNFFSLVFNRYAQRDTK